MRRRFTQVLKGHIALATARFPTGTRGSQLDILARQYLWADGVDYAHGTGHGVGAYLAVHEGRSEENTSELQSLMRNSYAVFCLKKKKTKEPTKHIVRRIHNRKKNPKHTDNNIN